MDVQIKTELRMTFLSFCLITDEFTFLTSAGEAITLTPAQVFHNTRAINALSHEMLTFLTKKMVASATKSA